MCSNQSLDFVNIKGLCFGQHPLIYFKILSRLEILTKVSGHNCFCKLMCNNPNLDLANINAYAKFYQIQVIRS